MKKSILMILSLLISFPVFSQTIKIGYFQSAPYVYKDKKSGEIKGATYEYLSKKIAPVMGVKFLWNKEPLPIARMLNQLEKGTLDASAMFAKNRERAKKFMYPDKPYFISHPTLAVRINSKLKKVNHLEDLLGHKIAFCGKSYISPFMRDKRIKWDLLYSSSCIEQNLRRLVAGRVYVQYQPSEVGLLFYARKNNFEKKIRLVQLPEKVDVYTPFSKRAGARYIAKFNLAMKKAGGIKTFMKYLAKYIDINKL